MVLKPSSSYSEPSQFFFPSPRRRKRDLPNADSSIFSRLGVRLLLRQNPTLFLHTFGLSGNPKHFLILGPI
jgi:hypothetical protein